MVYLMTYSTHFIYGYMAVRQTEERNVLINQGPRLGRVQVLATGLVHVLQGREGHGLFNDALNTFYLRLYGV